MNVSEMKKRTASPPPAVGDWSVLLKGLQKQMGQTQNLMKEQVLIARKQLKASDAELQWMDRLHDRLDSLVVENRVTNVLLSELVALHQTVVTDDTDEAREAIRNDAYYKVRNAE